MIAGRERVGARPLSHGKIYLICSLYSGLFATFFPRGGPFLLMGGGGGRETFSPVGGFLGLPPYKTFCMRP